MHKIRNISEVEAIQTRITRKTEKNVIKQEQKMVLEDTEESSITKT